MTIDSLPKRVIIGTPLGPFQTTMHPDAKVSDLIEHVVSEKPLARGDVFELAVGGQVVPSDLYLDMLPEGGIELLATGTIV